MSGTGTRVRRVSDRLPPGEADDLSLDVDPSERERFPEPGAPAARVEVGHVGSVDRHGRRPVEVIVDGWRFDLVVEDAERADLLRRASRERASGALSGGPLEIRAIIPGRVASMLVAAGDGVTVGQAMLVVEAMKMQNELRAPRDGTVARVAVGAGQTIEIGDLLVVLT